MKSRNPTTQKFIEILELLHPLQLALQADPSIADGIKELEAQLLALAEEVNVADLATTCNNQPNHDLAQTIYNADVRIFRALANRDMTNATTFLSLGNPADIMKNIFAFRIRELKQTTSGPAELLSEIFRLMIGVIMKLGSDAPSFSGKVIEDIKVWAERTSEREFKNQILASVIEEACRITETIDLNDLSDMAIILPYCKPVVEIIARRDKSVPSHIDTLKLLENACVSLQPDVVRFLLNHGATIDRDIIDTMLKQLSTVRPTDEPIGPYLHKNLGTVDTIIAMLLRHDPSLKFSENAQRLYIELRNEDAHANLLADLSNDTPWTPEQHAALPSDARECVVTALLLEQRARRVAADERHQQLMAGIGKLPRELLFLGLGYGISIPMGRPDQIAPLTSASRKMEG